MLNVVLLKNEWNPYFMHTYGGHRTQTFRGYQLILWGTLLIAGGVPILSMQRNQGAGNSKKDCGRP